MHATHAVTTIKYRILSGELLNEGLADIIRLQGETPRIQLVASRPRSIASEKLLEELVNAIKAYSAELAGLADVLSSIGDSEPGNGG